MSHIPHEYVDIATEVNIDIAISQLFSRHECLTFALNISLAMVNRQIDIEIELLLITSINHKEINIRSARN